MKVLVNLEMDYEEDKDVLFFISHEKLVTKCIKSISMKKERSDKNDNMTNNFGNIMGKAFNEKLIAADIITSDNNQSNENNDFIQ